MPPSMDRREREANRRLNAELLAKELRELSTGNREPDSWRRRRLSRGYTNCIPEYRVIDGDCSIFSCAVATKSEISEAESGLGEAEGPEDADPERAWLQGFEELGVADRIPHQHGPVDGDERDKRLQHRSDSGAATGSPSTVTEATVLDPGGPKDRLPNNQHARDEGPLLHRDTVRANRDRRRPRKKLSIPVPRMIDPNMSVCRRDYIRRDSIQDGVRLAMIPKTHIGEHKLLLPNVVNAVEYARGYRPAPVRRMRLEGDDDDDDRGCDSSFDIMKDSAGAKDTSMESSVEGSACNEPMLQKKNFWLGFSTLAAWILRIR